MTPAALQLQSGRPRALDAAQPVTANDVVALVGHELRTPLATISAALELLRDTADADGAPALLETAHRESQRLVGLFEAALRGAELTAGGAIDKTAVTSVKPVIDDCLDGTRGSARNAELSSHYEPALPDVSIEREALAMVVNNLVMNAIKHAHGRRIRVSAGGRGDDVFIAVEDDGAGMPTHIRDRMRGRSQRRGRGLGLHVARSLVQKFGGELYIDRSGDLGGAACIVQLPKAVAR